jgi:hypothetical protein
MSCGKMVPSCLLCMMCVYEKCGYARYKLHWRGREGIPESIKWLNEDQGFLAVIIFGSSPIPFPPSVSSACDTQDDWERETTCWQKRGKGGRGRSQIILRRESLVLYKSFNTLWGNLTPFRTKMCVRTTSEVVFFLILLYQLCFLVWRVATETCCASPKNS